MPRDEVASPQPALLGFLMLHPAHPYELNQEFDRELGRVWRVGQSHLYAHLSRLEESGYATVAAEAQAGRPARKVYRITPSGKKLFLEWLRAPTERVRDIRLELLARLYFYDRMRLPGLAGLAAGQKALLESRVASLDCGVAEAKDGFSRLVLDFRRSEIEAIIRWLDRCVEEAEWK
jgi:DNA-binding PadR family transcriptional regulator